MIQAPRIIFRLMMKRVCMLSVSILFAASLIGCGSGDQTGSGSHASADNWQFLLAPASSEVAFTNDIEAVLSLTPDKFIGTARIFYAVTPNSNIPCYTNDDPIPLSGTIDSQGNISVTSVAIRGQVLTFTGVLATDRSSVSLGTYAFKGGCADGHSGSLTGVKFKPIGGAYTGTFAASNSSIAVASELTQSTSRDNSGFLEVKGTVSYTSSGCTEKFTITRSQLAGGFILLDLRAEDGAATTIYGNVNPKANQLDLADYESGCNGVGGVGVLSLQ